MARPSGENANVFLGFTSHYKKDPVSKKKDPVSKKVSDNKTKKPVSWAEFGQNAGYHF